MAGKFTREQLVAMGMDEKQIEIILSAYGAAESEDAKQAAATVTPMPKRTVQQDSTVKVQPANCDYEMAVTSITDLQSYAKGTVVRFPDFAEGQPFVARVRRPSMLVLAKQKKIPNTLLQAAGELFSKGGAGLDADNEKMLEDAHDITEVICEAALIEPSLEDIHNAGMELSDDQLMAIFNYTQTGIKALESFRN